ncbi:HEAT repeat domain-containing protein [Tautonia sociabilis]|uniref:C-type cytochrome n=1 Tax=Tautonia sociabilis TaxID=2080755 RepID=A0A432MGI7_9BACT|nr:HEAT repeat domain-containing protein [Tautonia sociabilis]RUL85825.1 c-type cytochrome [Tautonia sociabilis]
MRRPSLSMPAIALLALSPIAGAADAPLPAVPEGWRVELVAEAPEILYPTAIVAAPDGTIYLGQDPMDMPGPPTEPIDSVVSLRPDGTITTFASGLWAVMGLEWIEDTLYVVHAPFLSAFRDTDGDGRADERRDLVTGLGPEKPGFSGLNDHVPSGMELGMDGFLYIAVGDKGIPRAVGTDGETIQLKGGGVIRVRPDGSDLQVVSTGERNPLSAMLTATDEIFTYGNDDDSKKWPNSLTHHIVGGHYGYPYEFLLRPERCLPIVSGQIGGSGTQGMISKGDGLPGRYLGNLFLCDWGLQTVFRVEVSPNGATFRMARREPFVTAGEVPDFRPFSIAPSADGASLYLVDWGIGNWLLSGAQTGRLYRLWYDGPDAVAAAAEPETLGIAALDHPNHEVRLRAQRALAGRGASAVGPLVDLLGDASRGTQGRLHAIWALDAIGSPEATAALRKALADADPIVRSQAAKRAGLRKDSGARPTLERLLDDPDPVVRREASIALGLLGDPASAPALMASLGDPDPTVAWSIRQAIRTLDAWDADLLLAALTDPGRRAEALKLTDEAWAVPVADALANAVSALDDAGARAEVVGNLAGILLAYPEWDGEWFGTNPLAGAMPRKTEPWDREGMRLALIGLIKALDDPDATVRGRAIVGLRPAGPTVGPYLRARLDREADGENLRALALILGDQVDVAAVPSLARLATDSQTPMVARAAAVDALGNMPGPDALKALFGLTFDPDAPPELVARALPPLASSRALPPNDLASFLDREAPAIRIAALGALAAVEGLPEHLKARVASRLDDPDPTARVAAIAAVAALGHRPAVPSLVAIARSADVDPTVRSATVRALAALPDPDALPVYLEALGDRDAGLRRSAESALLAIRDRVRPQLEARASASDLTAPEAASLERLLTRFRPIVDWRVIGPFARTTARVFLGEPSIDFSRTHSGVEGRPISWQERRGDPRTGRVVIDDFKGGRGDLGGFGYDETSSPDLAAFAFAEIPSPTDREALLLFGSSGSLIAELNGEQIHAFSEYAGRPYAPDSDRVRVLLKAGSNRLVMRVRQGIGTWSFSVQVSEPGQRLLASPPAGEGIEALRSFALAHEGDPARGEAIFFAADGVGCAKCHAADGKGTADIGPDLTGLASKYDRAELIRSVLEPSQRIATGYQPVLVATDDGRVLTGLVREETADELVLADAEANLIRLPKARIEERRVGQTSIMPGGLAEALCPEEFADLIAYLGTLTAPAGEP